MMVYLKTSTLLSSMSSSFRVAARRTVPSSSSSSSSSSFSTTCTAIQKHHRLRQLYSSSSATRPSPKSSVTAASAAFATFLDVAESPSSSNGVNGHIPWSFLFMAMTSVTAASATMTKKKALAEGADNNKDDHQQPKDPSRQDDDEDDNDDEDEELKKEEWFEGGQCLKRQLYQPRVPYPAWDYNWDGKMVPETSLRGFQQDYARKSYAVNHNRTRHVLLVRHGQYDESSSDDAERVLTPLGIRQARQTGRRIAHLLQGSTYEIMVQDDEDDEKKDENILHATDHNNQNRNHNNRPVDESFHGPCYLKSIHVSNMTRAKQTAQYIADEINNARKAATSTTETTTTSSSPSSSTSTSTMNVSEPDPLLNEALPCPMIPIRPDIANAIKEIDENHERLEQAFLKYIYRDTSNSYNVNNNKNNKMKKNDDDLHHHRRDDDDDDNPDPDEFEIVVCHGNVIRYFFCRALQLPPEAWLRLSTMNCSITYLVIRPDGTVSARMMGDVGHLSYDEMTFSNYYGLKY